MLLNANLLIEKLSDEEFRQKFDRIVGVAVTLSQHDDAITSLCHKSAESEVIHKESLQKSFKWMMGQLFQINKNFCNGKLIGYIHLDNRDEIDMLICEIYDFAITHVDDLFPIKNEKTN